LTLEEDKMQYFALNQKEDEDQAQKFTLVVQEGAAIDREAEVVKELKIINQLAFITVRCC